MANKLDVVSMLAIFLASAGVAGIGGMPVRAEVPMLQARVDAGELPPLAERLPERPEVVTPHESVGTYGGTMRRGLRGSSDFNNLLRIVGPQGLTRWNPSYTELMPNVAESYEISDDRSVFTFHLRPGMKWSDGTPFTADDILFNMQDLVLNEDFAPTSPTYMVDGVPVEVEKVDDETVTFTFAGPYGDFLAELASPLGQHPVLYPKHYCGQFHPTYNDAIDQTVAENNASGWQDLLLAKCGDLETVSRWGNPDKPTLDPWIVVEPYTGGATRVVLERNPYFWQVDTEGQQLPYVDQVVSRIQQDVESLILEAIGGQIDMQHRHLGNAANRPVLAENREKGNYDFFEAKAVGGTNMAISFNLVHKDPEMRELFNQRDFRVAMSQALDRDQIIEIAMLGQGEPWQGGPFEDHPYHHARRSTQYLEFDQDKANALLDGLGYTERNQAGIRLLPSGRPISFQCDVIPTLVPEWVDILELVAQQWAEVGVDMDVNSLERTLFYERTSTNADHDCAVWGAEASWVPGQIPQQIVSVHHDSRHGIPWVHWYKSGGAEGEEPPDHMKKRMELWNQARATVDQQQRIAILHQIADIAADQFEVIGISKAQSEYGIRTNNLANVPASMPRSWYYPTPAPTLPAQYYFKQ